MRREGVHTIEAIFLNEHERGELLAYARARIEARLQGLSEPGFRPSGAAQEEPCGAFVTLRLRKRLRGCIGNLASSRPLWQTVGDMAEEAAFGDPRFEPLREDEWSEVKLELSVLSPLRRVDDPEEVRVGEHGVVMSQGGKRGVLLPQVPTEYGWDRETFLKHTCLKAGLAPDAWRSGAAIEVFTSLIIEEAE